MIRDEETQRVTLFSVSAQITSYDITFHVGIRALLEFVREIEETSVFADSQ
jgi:hypothetical protein